MVSVCDSVYRKNDDGREDVKMDAKEALKQFDSYHQSGFSKSETPNSAVLLFAIMAIKKQVPAKITIRRYDNEGKILNGDCPVCGQVSPHSDYCLDCGQKLDWPSDKE